MSEKEFLTALRAQIDRRMSQIGENTGPKEPKVLDLSINSGQYIAEKTPKKQIVLHHTVSGGSAQAVLNWWNYDPKRIATHFIIDRDGQIFQLFSLDFWAHHIGLKDVRNTKLNKESVGIELVAWGGLTKENGRFINAYGKPVDDSEVIECKYRGFEYFQKYSDLQVNACRDLIRFLGAKLDIPVRNSENIFEVSEDAINSKPGVWAHTSYRRDKSDIFPQQEMIDMLKAV